MEPLVATKRRLHRMERECAGSVGQALLLGLASALLVALLGLTAALG
jgi:Tfp pilus assembly protein PilX